MKQNQQELMDLMYYHKLSPKKVAEVLGVRTSTVYVWRCNSSNPIPADKLAQLKSYVESNHV